MIITLESKIPTCGISYEYKGKTKTLFGGSFFEAPSTGYFTVNLMQEIPLDCDAYVPIRDFDVPTDKGLLVEAFERVLEDERDTFVGCFGGKGRTGLFMACFLKYLGYPNAIAQVRQEYNEHACETLQQMEYVWSFDLQSQNAQACGLEESLEKKEENFPADVATDTNKPLRP